MIKPDKCNQKPRRRVEFSVGRHETNQHTVRSLISEYTHKEKKGSNFCPSTDDELRKTDPETNVPRWGLHPPPLGARADKRETKVNTLATQRLTNNSHHTKEEAKRMHTTTMERAADSCYRGHTDRLVTSHPLAVPFMTPKTDERGSVRDSKKKRSSGRQPTRRQIRPSPTKRCIVKQADDTGTVVGGK